MIRCDPSFRRFLAERMKGISYLARKRVRITDHIGATRGVRGTGTLPERAGARVRFAATLEKRDMRIATRFLQGNEVEPEQLREGRGSSVVYGGLILATQLRIGQLFVRPRA